MASINKLCKRLHNLMAEREDLDVAVLPHAKWLRCHQQSCREVQRFIKYDITLCRKRKVGALLDRLLVICRDSVRARALLVEPAPGDRIVRITNLLARAGLLRECRPDHNSATFLLGDTTAATTGSIGNVVAVPPRRVFDVQEQRLKENLPVTAQLVVENARMEVLGMPNSEWDVVTQMGPSRVLFKQGLLPILAVRSRNCWRSWSLWSRNVGLPWPHQAQACTPRSKRWSACVQWPRTGIRVTYC
jgi:hypothetical protein